MKKKLPSKKHKGLFIYCSKCKKYFSWTQKKTINSQGKSQKMEPECGETQKNLSSCKFPNRHRYKSRLHVPGTYGRRISKTHESESYSDAVVEAIEFEQGFKAEMQIGRKVSQTSQRHYLFDVQIQYIDFLDNIDVPEHQKIQRSERHIREVQTCLLLFNEALTKNKINKKMLLVDQISDNYVGYFHSYLLNDKKYSSKTYNNKISVMKGFYKWVIEKFELQVYNPFEKVRKRAVVIKKDTITQNEYQSLLKIISPENGSVKIGLKQARNRYKPYLKDGIELALHTGGRREEIVNLKWDMIHEVNNEPTYIQVRNLKVERLKGEGFNENVAPKVIPVTKSLKKLLFRMGYENKKGSSQYILQPDRRKTSTYAMMDNLSKGFSHFYKQLNTGRELQLKSLRKTYLTYLSSAMSGDTKKLSSHTTDDVLQKHYIDNKVVSKAVKELSIFNA